MNKNKIIWEQKPVVPINQVFILPYIKTSLFYCIVNCIHDIVVLSCLSNTTEMYWNLIKRYYFKIFL